MMTWPIDGLFPWRRQSRTAKVAKLVICLYLALLLSIYFVIAIVICLYLALFLSYYFVISIVIKLNLTLLLLVIFVISIVIKLSLTLLLSVICYLIVSNFTASSILSYVLYDGLYETQKIKVLCIFIARILFLSIKHNLGYQLCPNCKPFIIIFA